MATTHFAGPLEIGIAPAPVSRPLEIIAVPVAVTATANTDITILLPNCRIVRIVERTTVAFTGATVMGQLGTTVGGQQLSVPQDIKPQAAERLLVLADTFSDDVDKLPAGNIFYRVVQTVPTAVGAAVLLIAITRLGEG